MMQCTDIDELMMDFIYRELETTRDGEFRAHVASCSRCGAELASLERTRSALRELPDAEPPAAVTARLLHEAAKRVPRATDEERGGMLSWLAGLFRPVMAHPGWAAAASLVVLVGVVYLQQTRRMSSKSQENPAVGAQRSEESEKDSKMAEAAPTVPSAGAVGAVGAATSSDPSDPASRPEPVVVTAPPGVTVTAEGYADSTVTLDGLDGKKVRGRAADLEAGEHQVRLVQEPTTPEPSPKETPLKRAAGGKGGGADDTFDYRAKSEDVARTGVLMPDKGITSPSGTVVGGESMEGRRNQVPAAQPVEDNKPAEPAKDKAKPQVKSKDAPAKPADADKEMSADDEGDEAEVVAIVKPSGGRAPSPPPANNRPTAPASPTPAAEAPPTDMPARVNNQGAQNQRRDVSKADSNVGNTGTGGSGNVARGGQEHKAESKLDTTPAKLHGQARQAAKTGNCSVALRTRDKIQKIDPDYYKRNVAKDSVFSECDANKQKALEKKAKKPAPAQDEMMEPAPAQQSNE